MRAIRCRLPYRTYAFSNPSYNSAKKKLENSNDGKRHGILAAELEYKVIGFFSWAKGSVS